MSDPNSRKLFETFRSDYDNKFTENISKKMQMPTRLGATTTVDDAFLQPLNDFQGNTAVPRLDKEYYTMQTPPSVISLRDCMYASSDDEEVQVMSDVEESVVPQATNHAYLPQKRGEFAEHEIDVPMTPGSMLLLQNGDEMAVIRRQVSKLTRHVLRLQEDNSRRRNRELILYPVLVGYCLIQLAKMFLRSK